MDLSSAEVDGIFQHAMSLRASLAPVEPDPVAEIGLDVCPRCGSMDIVLIRSDGDLVCQGCGLVVAGHYMDDDPEWRNDAEEGLAGDKSRVGAPGHRLLTSCNLSTVIPKIGKMRRMAVIHERQSMSYKDRSLYKEFKEITHVCKEKLHLSQAVIDMSHEMLRDIKDQKITRGENHKALVVCCVYYASKLDHVNAAMRKKENFCNAFQVEKSVFTQASKTFLDLVQDKHYYEKIMEDACKRGVVSSTLAGLPITDRKSFYKLVNGVEDGYEYISQAGDGVTDSKTPNAIITALAFIVASELGLGITKNDIKTKCSVSALTLNKTIALITPIWARRSVQ